MRKRPLRPAVVTVAVLGAAFLAASPACADPPPRPAGCPTTPADNRALSSASRGCRGGETPWSVRPRAGYA